MGKMDTTEANYNQSMSCSHLITKQAAHNEGVNMLFYHQHRNYGQKILGRAPTTGYAVYKDIWVVIINNTQRTVNVSFWSKSKGQCELEFSKIQSITCLPVNTSVYKRPKCLLFLTGRERAIFSYNLLISAILSY